MRTRDLRFTMNGAAGACLGFLLMSYFNISVIPAAFAIGWIGFTLAGLFLLVKEKLPTP